VQEGVRARGHDAFLEQHLEDVGEGLDDAEARHQLADEHGPVAHVHPADHLALEQRVERHGHRERDHQRDDLDQHPSHRTGGTELQQEVTQGSEQVHQAPALVIVSAPWAASGAVAG
jgi:hypothetical protein